MRAEKHAPSEGGDGLHVHAETGRGRGALSVVLALPRNAVDALPELLRRLHGTDAPLDLDSRLGRLAADAPVGTAFAVGLGRQVWVFPSSRVLLRRTIAGEAETLTEPQVLELGAGERLELLALETLEAPETDGAAKAESVGEGERGASLRAVLISDETSDPGTASPPPAPTASAATQPAPQADHSAPLSGAPRRITGRTRALITGVLAVGVGFVAIWATRSFFPSEDELASDAPSMPLSDRLVGLLTGAGDRPDSGDPPSEAAVPEDPAETVRARVEPEAADGIVAEQEVTHRAPPAQWAFRARAAITSSPLVVGDRVVFGSRDSTVYCLDTETGDVQWVYAAGDGVGSSPTAHRDLCFVGTYAGRLLALETATGELRWEARAGGRIVSSPCVVADRVIVGSYDRRVHAWSAETGEPAWTVRTGDVVRASPEPVAPEAVVVGSTDGTLRCLDATTGEIRWRRELGGRILAAAAYDAAHGRVVAGTASGRLAAFAAADGAPLWSRDLGGDVNARPRFAGDLLLAGTGDGRLFGLDPSTGEERWNVRAERGFDASPLIRGDRVVAPSFDGIVRVLALADGREIERRVMDAEIYTSPAANADHVFLGTMGGTFHALTLP